MYARVTKAIPWILSKIQTGECGWIKDAALSNQIYLVTFMCLKVDTSFIFTKKSNVAKCW